MMTKRAPADELQILALQIALELQRAAGSPDKSTVARVRGALLVLHGMAQIETTRGHQVHRAMFILRRARRERAQGLDVSVLAVRILLRALDSAFTDASDDDLELAIAKPTFENLARICLSTGAFGVRRGPLNDPALERTSGNLKRAYSRQNKPKR